MEIEAVKRLVREMSSCRDEETAMVSRASNHCNLLLYFSQVISLMFVGHPGELALSGAAMATSFASDSGFSILVSCVYYINRFTSFCYFRST